MSVTSQIAATINAEVGASVIAEESALDVRGLQVVKLSGGRTVGLVYAYKSLPTLPAHNGVCDHSIQCEVISPHTSARDVLFGVLF